MFAEDFWHHGTLSWHGKNSFRWNHTEILDKMSKHLKYILKTGLKEKESTQFWEKRELSELDQEVAAHIVVAYGYFKPEYRSQV